MDIKTRSRELSCSPVRKQRFHDSGFCDVADLRYEVCNLVRETLIFGTPVYRIAAQHSTVEGKLSAGSLALRERSLSTLSAPTKAMPELGIRRCADAEVKLDVRVALYDQVR